MMQGRILMLAIVVATLTVTPGQGAIVYASGPSFQIPGRYWTRGLDVNSDGTADFTFWETGMICTLDVPTSSCGWPFYVGAVTTNEMLMAGHDIQPQRFGDRIGDSAPPGGAWDRPAPGLYGAGLAYWWYYRPGRVIDGHLVDSGWSGAVGDVGVGYLGVRFYAADGFHYGWVRVRLPQAGGLIDLGHASASYEPMGLELVPVVLDWAYETLPNTPIPAGAIDSNEDSTQLWVHFGPAKSERVDPEARRLAGTFILTGNTLRGELSLAGRFDSAEIRGPADPRSNAKPVWSFGVPLVSREDYTAFFGEATLTHGQVIQLLRGALYVSLNDGEAVGQIVTMADTAALMK